MTEQAHADARVMVPEAQPSVAEQQQEHCSQKNLPSGGTGIVLSLDKNKFSGVKE
jgi:hypothetical protein